jgi:hypothetical protein
MSKTIVTLQKLGHAMAESFRELAPKQQVQLRRQMYERITGKVFRPN